MGIYSRVILPRLVDFVLGTETVKRDRKLALADVQGRVLEIGFGSGPNLPYYGKNISELVAIDPDVAEKYATHRLALAPFPVRFEPLSGESLPLGDGEFDAVVSTFTLCTIPDVARAIAESRRVLKPGGRFFFLEHGRSADTDIALWQSRLNSIYSPLAGGCRLDRDVPALITEAGLVLEKLERYESDGPRLFSPRFRGIARKV
jgi:ubiquinone/menaquinone biosynthesis C-methylase UbiE